MTKNNKYNMPLIHRDLSWLSFNYRVLQEAKDPSVPLFERIKFLGIYSSNLDEFFRVRVASLKTLIRLGKKTKLKFGYSPDEVLLQIRQIVQEQQKEFIKIYQQQILPQLNACNIHILRPKDLDFQQRQFIDSFFEERLIQHLQPVLIIKHKIRTFLVNNALYLAVQLGTKSTNRYAVVRIPSHKFQRFIHLPTLNNQTDRKELIILDDIIRYCLPSLFPGYEVKAAYSIKMTRDAELHILDECTGDLVEKIKKSLNKRNIGRGTRFVYDKKMPKMMLNFFQAALNVSSRDLQEEGRYHNNFDFFKFPSFGLQHLKDVKQAPLKHFAFEQNPQNLFKVISQADQLLNFPYTRYEYVLRLLEQAVLDPKVKEIHIAQYRVAEESRVISALRSALEEGKKVMVFMEVKARFDEEANLNWGEKLEQWGAKVVYSFPELKVHSKVLMISREETKGMKYYCYLGTGNFNEDTANIYSDFGFFTADKRIGNEVCSLFRYLEYQERPKDGFKHLLVGQFGMRRNIYKLIEAEIEAAKAGKEAKITIKLNSIQDERMIKRLYAASEAGVKIQLIIRGICSIVPNIKGFSENISITSIVDRYLEHARIYIFHNEGNHKVYLSSADWMTRNLYHRIETAFPIYDKNLKQEILDFLSLQFQDNVKQRILDQNQQNLYLRTPDDTSPKRAQEMIYQYYKDRLQKQQYTLNKDK